MLVEKLDCWQEKVISFIGGGGKTSAIRRFAKELNYFDRQVLVTTTTRLGAEEGLSFTHRFLLTDLLKEGAREIGLPEQKLLLFASALTPNKLVGVSPREVDWIHSLVPERSILVEADGAAKKPFKAPASHEPVIPASSRLVVALIGAWALGLPLLSQYFHRPEIISRLSGLALGEPLTVEAAGRVIVHPEGYRKGVPPGSRFAVLINGVGPENEAKARRLGRYLREEGVEKVLLTNVQEKSPVQEALL